MKMQKVSREELKGIIKEGMDLKFKTDADAILKDIDSVFEVVAKALKVGQKVAVGKYITIEKVVKESHIARNPATGESVEVPAKDILKIKFTGSGKALLVADEQ